MPVGKATIDWDGHDLLVRFDPFSAKVNDALKAELPYSNRRWDSEEKAWRITTYYVDQVCDIFERYNYAIRDYTGDDVSAKVRQGEHRSRAEERELERERAEKRKEKNRERGDPFIFWNASTNRWEDVQGNPKAGASESEEEKARAYFGSAWKDWTFSGGNGAWWRNDPGFETWYRLYRQLGTYQKADAEFRKTEMYKEAFRRRSKTEGSFWEAKEEKRERWNADGIPDDKGFAFSRDEWRAKFFSVNPGYNEADFISWWAFFLGGGKDWANDQFKKKRERDKQYQRSYSHEEFFERFQRAYHGSAGNGGTYWGGAWHDFFNGREAPGATHAATVDHYAVLGLKSTCSQEEAKSAYRQKAIENHPDRGGSTETMTKVNVAWDAIKSERGWK